MTIDNHVNYVDTYFEYKTLTKIHGEPSYEGIKKIKDELKANAMAVNSELGGGQHGHLGLVLTPEEYARISNVPYERPDHPGDVDIPGNTTQHEATRLLREHKDAIKLFRETTDMEKAMRYQITAAVPEEYLDALRNREANAITNTIPEIIEYLFDNYGIVEMEEVLKEEHSIRESKYSPPTPLVTIFNKIEDLQDLATAAYNPYTQVQLLNIGIQILKDSGAFTEGLKLWYQRPQQEHNWQTFKQHFQEELKKLKKVLGPTMRGTQFHVANYISEEMRHEIQNIKNEVTNVEEKILQAVATNTSIIQELSNDMYNTNEPIETANATIQPNLTTELLKMMQDMQRELQDVKSKMHSNNTMPYQPHPQGITPSTQNPNQWENGQGHGNGAGRGRGGRGFGRGRGFRRKNTKFYCWSHGACAHSSSFCKFPKEGHQWQASFENKMGGSTDFCNPTNQK